MIQATLYEKGGIPAHNDKGKGRKEELDVIKSDSQNGKWQIFWSE